jgi:DNA-binding transcriptional LysR family regulator
VSRRVEVVVPSFELVLKLVSGTQRIAMSYVKYARMHAKQYSLRLVEPPFRLPRVELYIQWHRCMNDDTALTWFRGLLKSADV